MNTPQQDSNLIMGTFRYPVEIGTPSGTQFELVNPMVDTGATYTFVPSSLLERLNVEPIRQTGLIMADGRRMQRALGQTWIRAAGREVMTLVVFGDEDITPLLGAYALEGLGLGVDPVHSQLIEVEALI